MNILFISIYCKRWGPREELGIGYIAALLQQAGYNVEIIAVPDEISQTELLLKELFKTISPFLVGIACSHTTIALDYYIELSRIIRQYNGSCHITCGGYFATFNASKLLDNWPELDSVVIGEGELTTVSLADNLRDNLTQDIEGILVRGKQHSALKTGRRVLDLDVLPFPMRDVIGLPKSNMSSISTSRGCLAHCTFCNVPEWTKRHSHGWRGRSAKNIVEEMAFLKLNKQISRFSIVDSSFEDSISGDYQRLGQIANLLITQKINISYYVFFRAETICDPTFSELLPLLIKSGLRRIFIGIESGSENVLHSFAKKANVKENFQALQILATIGIHVSVGFIMFTPNSTYDTLFENLKFLKSTGLLYYTPHLLSRLELYSGTAEVSKLSKQGSIAGDPWCNQYAYTFDEPNIAKLAISFSNILATEKDYYWEGLQMGFLIVKSALLTTDNPLPENILQLARKLKDDLDQLASILSYHNEEFFIKAIELSKEGWDEDKFAILAEEHLDGYQMEICYTGHILTKEFLLNAIRAGVKILY